MPSALLLGNCYRAFLYYVKINEESRASICLLFSLGSEMLLGTELISQGLFSFSVMYSLL